MGLCISKTLKKRLDTLITTNLTLQKSNTYLEKTLQISEYKYNNMVSDNNNSMVDAQIKMQELNDNISLLKIKIIELETSLSTANNSLQEKDYQLLKKSAEIIALNHKVSEQIDGKKKKRGLYRSFSMGRG